MSLLGGQARQLRVALQQAPDHAVGRVVAMLDGLNDRGAADAVLDSVRPRLRRLQPPRPLRLPRLLFLPVEGALVEARDWRPGNPYVPRSAIAPIAALLARDMPALAEEIEAAALGHTMANSPLVSQLGGLLWPAAGAGLRFAIPPNWAASGLPPEAAEPILALCCGLWRHAVALWQARSAAEEGPPEPLVRAALAPLALEGNGPLTAGMTLLLRSATQPAQVAAVAATLSNIMSPLVERELTALLVADAAAVAEAETAREMADTAGRLGRRLADMECTGTATQREERRRQAVTLRRDTSQACHQHLAQAVVKTLLLPAVRAAAGPPAADATVLALEIAARDLRQLEVAGRRLGHEAAFDRTLRDALQQLHRLAQAPGGLGRIELARLAEILAGPEAGCALLADTGRPA
ncbi:MAG: hypothetical protein B7Z53_00015 [Rhodospirillales bacterium 12-71-4]|nr:MAG: hypothetical protein B7Z53_00015 [Rhodospirillales bacterium 12-71-4]